MAQITLRDYLQETEDAISAGRTDDALAKCQHMLDQYPEALDVQRLLGEAHLAQGNLDEAQHAFDWVLTNDPENVVAYCDRALISERMSDYDTALDCYQQAYELSRGNSQIRNEFNKLSARVGQQGFMFSRAGLARLYMRGDLLTQAIQEWETVLVASPERLDARTGLLETYWREGTYERVEQLATQILEDVPGCLKVLLLLAHVTSAGNMQRAKELVQQAKALDPDLVMAQELFADYKAANASDPFFQLLPQAPVALQPTNGATKQSASSPDLPPIAPVSVASQSDVSPWLGLEAWNGNATSSAQEKESDLPIWATSSILGLDAKPQQELPNFSSSSLEKPEEEHFSWHGIQQHAQQEEPDNEAWSLSQLAEEQSAANMANSTEVDDQPHMDKFSRSDLAGVELWNEQSSQTQEPLFSSWGISSVEGTSAPPDWLSMLTQQEQPSAQEQPAEKVPPVEKQVAKEEPIVNEQPVKDIPVAKQAVQPLVVPQAAEVKAQKVQPAAEVNIPALDEEESFFGPEWLKSLGATSMEAENPAEVAAKLVEATPVEEIVAAQPLAQAPVETPVEEVEEDAAAKKQEQQVLATLEEIEQNLRSKGFVSLEPNSLSALAQAEGSVVAESKVSYTPAEEKPSLSGLYQDADLSSALAELGNLVTPKEDTEVAAQQASPEIAQQEQDSDPDWVRALRSDSATQQAFELPDWAKLLQSSALSFSENQQNMQSPDPEWTPSWQPTPTSTSPVPQEPQKVAQEPEWMQALQATPSQVSQTYQDLQAAKSFPAQERPHTTAPLQDKPAITSPLQSEEKHTNGQNPLATAFPQTNGASQMPTSPVFEPVVNVPPVTRHGSVRPDPLLDGELETTMKRPAVRLQHMQTRQANQRGTGNKNYAPERSVGRGSGEHAGPQDRLLKGYKYQLAGDYDAAMQEYKIIIKSSPDLLGEVVSNVRALLKLAPNYSAGYRVLGDAYMRQGEYLQAMEAYNKALTMAKKARG